MPSNNRPSRPRPPRDPFQRHRDPFPVPWLPEHGGQAYTQDQRQRVGEIERFFGPNGSGDGRDIASSILDRGPHNDLSQNAQSRADLAQRAGLVEAFRLRDEEDNRYASALSFLQQQFGISTQPSMTQGNINDLYSREADMASQGALRNFSNLRGHLGVAGIFGGGLAAGLGSQIELQRLGQLTGAKRDLAIEKARMDAQDRVSRFQQALGVAAFQGQSPSLLGVDALQNVQEVSLAQQGLYAGIDASNRAAAAASKAGKDSKIGSIIGGGLGLLGSIFG